jgi:hypothetical protein
VGGQSEATDKIIAMYLYWLNGDRLRQWLQWLPLVEYCYNSAHQAALQNSPFYVVYCGNPPSIRSYGPGDAKLLVMHH